MNIQCSFDEANLMMWSRLVCLMAGEMLLHLSMILNMMILLQLHVKLCVRNTFLIMIVDIQSRLSFQNYDTNYSCDYYKVNYYVV